MKKMFFELTSSSKKKKDKIEKKVEVVEVAEKEIIVEAKQSKKEVKVKELLNESELQYIEAQYQQSSSKKKDGRGDYVICTFLDTVTDVHDDVDLSWLEQGLCPSCNQTKTAGMKEYFEKRSIVANVLGGDPRMLRKLFWFREKESHDLKARFLTKSLLAYRKSLHFSQMFAYLSKKLEMPYGSNVLSVAWSEEDGYLACGCSGGLVKVLKIDVVEHCENGVPRGYLAAPTNISKNQTLEGHKAAVRAIAWNNKHKKLTTSDTKGLTTVWKMCRGSWCEEMVHNRGKAGGVRDLGWSHCGKKICIVYDDGSVIIGSSEGARLWGTELNLNNSKLAGVTWTPNGAQILFALASGEILIYDQAGTFQSKLTLKDNGGQQKKFSVDQQEEGNQVVKIRFYAGGIEFFWTLPTLAILWKNNCIHLLRNVHDEDPVMTETQILATCGEWSPNGQFFAVGGQPISSTSSIVVSATTSDDNFGTIKPLPFDQINVFSPFGIFLQSIKIPGTPCISLAWDSLSLRLAVGIGENIFFANVRPCYKFALVGKNTLVYAFSLTDGSAQLGFWDETKLVTQEIPGKIVDIKGNDDHCAILSLTTTGCYNATILNDKGNPIDSITIVTIDPFMINLTSSKVLICVAPNAVNVWRFDDSSSDDVIGTDLVARRRLRVFHIDESPTIIGESTDENKLKEPTLDPASCSDAVGQMLIVCRDSGKLQVYSLPHGALMNTIDTAYEMNFRPQRIWLNMDGSQVAMIDKQGHLSVCSLGSASIKTALARKLDRKDVWNLMWAADNPNLICVMEKTKLYVIRNGEAEEPVLTSAYLAYFKDLKVTSVLMDELFLNPEKPRSDIILRLESRALRETKSLIAKSASLAEISLYVEKNSHRILWKLLAEESFRRLDLEMAESSFLRSQDYAGVTLVKKLGSIQNELVRKAEIACYFHDFEKAETFYVQAGQKDAACEMWKLMNDWKRVDSTFPVGRQRSPDVNTTRNMSVVKGDDHFENHDWSKAVGFYETAGDTLKMLWCFFMLEDFKQMENHALSLRDGDPLLLDIAKMFESRGLCKEAMNAYLKYDHEKPLNAVHTAISLSQWNLALKVTQNYSLDMVEPLLLQYVVHLLGTGEVIPAIQLMIKSNKPYGAGKLLTITALRELEEDELDLVRIKKLSVFAAMLFEYKGVKYVRKGLERVSSAMMSSCKHKNNSKNEDEGDGSSSSDIFFENFLHKKYRPSPQIYKWMRETPWRGAEAVHYLILTQKLAYEGRFEDATRTALYLRNYMDILKEERVNSLVALVAANAGNFGVCSKAFMTLEGLDEEYEDLVSQLFSIHVPVDSPVRRVMCYKCKLKIPDYSTTCPECGTEFEICVLTGRPLSEHLLNIWTCQVCKHSSDKSKVKSRHTCPFCHLPRLSSLDII